MARFSFDIVTQGLLATIDLGDFYWSWICCDLRVLVLLFTASGGEGIWEIAFD